MSEFNIFRPLSNEEKVDTINLGTEDILTKFLKVLADKQAEYQRKMLPYDAYSAKIDFETKIRNQINENANIIDEEKKNRAVDFGDLDIYSDLKRFEFLEKARSEVSKMVAGTQVNALIGYRYKFKCNPRGNRISIYVETDKVEEFEKWLNNAFPGATKPVKEVTKKDEGEETKTKSKVKDKE